MGLWDYEENDSMRLRERVNEYMGLQDYEENRDYKDYKERVGE